MPPTSALATPAPTVRFERMALIGCGLIGGSVALALKAAGAVGCIHAYSPNSAELQWAVQHGIITQAATSVDAALTDADLIVLATPVGAMPTVLQHIATCATHGSNPPTLITDVGSTKANVLAAAAQYLPPALLARFVGAHPIAGREVSGVQHASAHLLTHARLILTPSAHSSAAALNAAHQLWTAAGCRIHSMSADEHDAIFAALSHLPHLAAFALMHATLDHPAQWLELAGSGFRDTTRIAASSPAMWRDIFRANRTHMLAQSQRLRQVLQDFEAAIAAADDGQALHALITAASQARAQYRSNP